MPEDKKKPGMALVISVTKPSPKKPTETATPDKDSKEKMITESNLPEMPQGTATLSPDYAAERARVARMPTPGGALSRQRELERQRAAQEAASLERGRQIFAPRPRPTVGNQLRAFGPSTTEDRDDFESGSAAPIIRRSEAFDFAWSILKREATIYDENVGRLGMQQRQGTATLDPNYPADRAAMARQGAAERQRELERQRLARQVAEGAQERRGIGQGRVVGSPY